MTTEPSEQAFFEWRFQGPDLDDWPGASHYRQALQAQIRRRGPQAARAATPSQGSSPGLRPSTMAAVAWKARVDGPEGDALIAEYLDWRDWMEGETLAEVGRQGYELVSLVRSLVGEVVHPDLQVRLPVPELRLCGQFRRAAAKDEGLTAALVMAPGATD